MGSIGAPELIILAVLVVPIVLALALKRLAPGRRWLAVLLALCGPFGQLYVPPSGGAIGILFALSIAFRFVALVPGVPPGSFGVATALIWIAAAEVLMLSRLKKQRPSTS